MREIVFVLWFSSLILLMVLRGYFLYLSRLKGKVLKDKLKKERKEK